MGNSVACQRGAEMRGEERSECIHGSISVTGFFLVSSLDSKPLSECNSVLNCGESTSLKVPDFVISPPTAFLEHWMWRIGHCVPLFFSRPLQGEFALSDKKLGPLLLPKSKLINP